VRKIDSKKFHIDLKLLETIFQNASKHVQQHVGQSQLLIYVTEFPNGKQELVFEQPCIYKDGASKFHRITENL
jgi:hypothetical protein